MSLGFCAAYEDNDVFSNRQSNVNESRFEPDRLIDVLSFLLPMDFVRWLNLDGVFS